MNKRTYRKLPHFSDELERQYQIRYKCTPYETRIMMHSRGVTREEINEHIQEQMGDIWKEYRAMKQKEARQNTFQPVTDSDIPFSYTDTDSDFLNHLYQIQEEQPLTILPDYDMRGEQLELSFT